MHRNLSDIQDPQHELDTLHRTAQLGHKGHSLQPSERAIAHRRTRNATWVAAVIGGLILAGIVYVILPQNYECRASIRLSGNTDTRWFEIVHQRFVQSNSLLLSAPNSTFAHMAGWRAETTPPDQVHLVVDSRDEKLGSELAESAAKQFIEEQNKSRLEILTTPTETEKVLSAWVATLRRRMEASHGEAESAKLQLADGDPTKSQAELLQHWSELFSEFEDRRNELSGQVRNLEHLREQPDPSHAVVNPLDRQAAIQANSALQQDFQELAVRLSETKQHLLNAWQKSAEPLESVHRASKELTATIQECVNPNATKDERTILQSLRESVVQHAEKLSAFSEAWGREFNGLRQAEIQPQSDEILSAFSRLRNLLADFVFQAGELTVHMRDRVHELSSASSDPARGAVLQSRLARCFQSVQTAQHHFEFSAGILDPKANFKLDAALRASRALWKRSHQQVVEIEARLQEEATKKAKSNRQVDLASATADVEKTRSALDEIVIRLVRLQAELNLGSGELESFFRHTIQAEMITSQMKTFSDDLNHAEDQIRAFESIRHAEAEKPTLQFAGGNTKVSMTHLIERLRIAGFAGFAGGVLVHLILRRFR